MGYSNSNCMARNVGFNFKLCQLGGWINLKCTFPGRNVKAILRDVMGEEKFYFSLFFIIHLCNDPCCHRIISPQCIRAGCFA